MPDDHVSRTDSHDGVALALMVRFEHVMLGWILVNSRLYGVGSLCPARNNNKQLKRRCSPLVGLCSNILDAHVISGMLF